MWAGWQGATAHGHVPAGQNRVSTALASRSLPPCCRDLGSVLFLGMDPL